MEFIVPLLIVVAAVLLVAVAVRILGRRGRGGAGRGPDRGPAGQGGAQNEEAARGLAAEASARLTPEQHRSVYSMIAQQNPVGAVKAYRAATGCSLREAAQATSALSRFPQPTPEPQWIAGAEPAAPVEPAAPKATVPEPAMPAPAPAPDAAPAAPARPVSGYRFRAIIAHGDDVREIVSTRLNEEIVAQVKAMALSGDRDGAKGLLLAHSEASEAEAAAFVELIHPEA
ncbi:hypothetical protein ACQCSX_11240 [Pseudarthrobacter sp. P1]|uniref:hypothetical protein n=1 Tax=Pseudarthrobacter sp. P1 TaxID=3418418 RepID=UPI003CF40416